jgi:outer membrane autotransporter protein
MKTVNALLLYRDGPLAAVSVTAPSALAALTASPISSAHEAAATMRSHLESIRYDRVINARRVRGSDLTGDPNDENTLVNVSETGVLAYVSGSASTTKNGSASDSPAFDLNNYAGSVGFDFLLGTGFNVGVNASYNRSHASLHNGGGKVDADTGRASLYASFMPSSRFFFDVQAFGGYTTYKYNRSTALGRESAKPDGYDYGANAYVGTVLSVNEWIHFTPYAGFEFVHTTVDAYTEDGSIAALRVQEVTQDSLLLKIGTGLNWVKPLSKKVVARFTFDAALAVEMLDSDARITAAFANDNSGNRFRFEAPARPERTLQVGPAVELSIGYNQSLSLGYTYEADFNNYTNHHVNATYRLRF